MHRAQIDVAGVNALAATDYTKKPNVFRLKLSNGAEYLFHAKDEVPPCIAMHLIFTLRYRCLFSGLIFSIHVGPWRSAL